MIILLCYCLQVPAVERNIVHANSDQNNILTQLGAVRHQLQLEQIRMEQYLQQQLKNKSWYIVHIVIRNLNVIFFNIYFLSSHHVGLQ